MKRWVIHLLISVVLLFNTSFLHAQSDPIICFSEEIAKQMVVELEQCRITDKQIDLLIKENEKLQEQIEYLKSMIELQKKQLQISKETIANLQEIIKYQNEAYKKVYKKSFFDRLKENNLFLTLGVIIGLIIHF